MSTKIPLITTAEQLLAAPDELGPCELVRGELIMMSPAGEEHSQIECNLHLELGAFVRKQGLGRVYMGDAGFLLQRDPDTVRAPDIAFVRASRTSAIPHKGYFPGPPDLAVEVCSPNDRPKEIDEKVADYLRLGVDVVWVIDPVKRTVTVHQADAEPQTLTEQDSLSESALLPGFAMPVGDLFAW